jgi:hypothetical protein
MDLVEMGWGGVDWIRLVQDWNIWKALVSAVMNLMMGKYEVTTQLVAS